MLVLLYAATMGAVIYSVVQKEIRRRKRTAIQRRIERFIVGCLLLTALTVAALAQDKKPADPAPPQLTAGELAALDDINTEFNTLEDQRKKIVAQQQMLHQHWVDLAAAVAKEHPGYLLSPDKSEIVPEPKKVEGK